MCRLLLARGRFSTRSLVSAAISMSEGHTADHEGPTRCHPNGWGAVWLEAGAARPLAVHRDTRPISLSVEDSPVPRVETRFMALHVRHATLPHTRGLEFTHPLERHGPAGPWYFMHNGYLPSVYTLLGRERSHFDSEEYFEYVVDAWCEALDAHATLEKLRGLPPGGTSCNAILVNPRRAYLIHWTPSHSPCPRYFTMYRLAGPESLIFSSERLPALAPPAHWEPLPPQQIFEIPLH
jgi:glutamine amidotransferase